MGQSSFRWVIILGDGSTFQVDSTPEDLSNVVDFTLDVACIVRVGFSS